MEEMISQPDIVVSYCRHEDNNDDDDDNNDDSDDEDDDITA